MTQDEAARLALRPYADDESRLDDVVVRDVEMFRAEMLGKDRMWLACYLPGTGVDHDRITFEVSVVNGQLRLEVEEHPAGSITKEEG